MIHSRPRQQRLGFSLIEMVAAMTIGSLLFGMTLVLLQSVLRADIASRRHLRQAQTLSRLGAIYRADVHAAEEATLAQDGQQLRLLGESERQVTYTLQEGRLRREVLRQDEVQHRDEFDLERIDVEFSLSALDDEIPELTVTEEASDFAQASEGHQPRLLLRVRAQVGYHPSTAAPAD